VTCFSVPLEEQISKLVIGKDQTMYTTLMIELRIPAREDNEHKVKKKKTRHTELDKLVET